MCVICYIPKNRELPDSETLRAMYLTNPDGMGFCTPTAHYKGLNYMAFRRALRKRRIEEPCIIHFRLATHGSVRRANCHPFHDSQTGVYFAHNGVLGVSPKGDHTDSETAFRDCFLPVIGRFGLQSPYVDEMANILNGANGSKFAFMQGDKVRLFGNFIEHNGLYYSNLRFLYRLYNRHDYRKGFFTTIGQTY